MHNRLLAGYHLAVQKPVHSHDSKMFCHVSQSDVHHRYRRSGNKPLLGQLWALLGFLSTYLLDNVSNFR